MNPLKKMREERGWTQEQFAKVCRLGVRTVQRIEAGEVQPSGETAMALADALGTTPAMIQEWASLRQRLRSAIVTWQARSPTEEELQRLPARLEPLFRQFHLGKSQVDEDRTALQRLSEERARLHAQTMELMDRRRGALRACFDDSVTSEARLALLEAVIAEQGCMDRLHDEQRALDEEVDRLTTMMTDRMLPLASVAKTLDRELDALGVYG